MYILFSPSETKNRDSILDSKCNFSFSTLHVHINNMVALYEKVLKNSTDEQLSKLFGLKDIKEVLYLQSKLPSTSQAQIALLRYSGVAYDYLDFNSLPTNSKEFLKEHLLIFSNLFGVVKGGDLISEYKISQGEKLDGFDVEKLHQPVLQPFLDELLKDEFVVDLRATYYKKFYSLAGVHVELEFLKNGKKVSHWAKAYRGAVARELSIHQPQNIAEFEKINFNGLKIVEIKEKKLARIYTFEIEV